MIGCDSHSRFQQIALLDPETGECRELRLEHEAACRPPVQQLLSHPGVGLLTALGTVLVLGPVNRFAEARKVTSYVGLIPREHSSGGHQRFGKRSKQGHRLLRFLRIEAAPSASQHDPQRGRRRRSRPRATRKPRRVSRVPQRRQRSDSKER